MKMYEIGKEATAYYNGELRNRLNHCCCKYCGGELSLRNIIAGDEKNGRVEIFCDNCDRIEFGVEKEVYQIAKYFVDTLKFDHYPQLEEGSMKNRMNIAKVCEIIQWGLNNLGYLNKDGFTHPVNIAKQLLGEDLILDDEQILKSEVDN